jgi:hypothetical protein
MNRVDEFEMDDDDDGPGEIVGGPGYVRQKSSELYRMKSGQITPGLNATTRGGYDTIPDMFHNFGHGLVESVRSKKRRTLNIVLMILLALTACLLVFVVSAIVYRRIILPIQEEKKLEARIRAHALAAAERVKRCQGIDWLTACDNLAGAGARRRLDTKINAEATSPIEDELLNSDDPTVTYDEFCLRVYRLKMYGNITFPYHSSQLLSAGGNQTMALFIQHGAMRDPEDYFCSFKQLMMKQNYRDFNDILVIAPDFNYEHDDLVHPRDAFWNSSKPWGDWRVGAESDPNCCGKSGRTVSSFTVLDNMLGILTNKRLFPNMNKISYVGHSAGKTKEMHRQMITREPCICT